MSQFNYKNLYARLFDYTGKGLNLIAADTYLTLRVCSQTTPWGPEVVKLRRGVQG